MEIIINILTTLGLIILVIVTSVFIVVSYGAYVGLRKLQKHFKECSNCKLCPPMQKGFRRA